MIAPTWEAHCEQYTAGRYSRDISDYDAMDRDADLLERILARAFYRLNERTRMAHSDEETTMGQCYGMVA